MTKAAELAKMGEVLTNSQIGGRRNIVINGAMQVAQRATSTSSYTSDGYSVCDRWMYRVSSLGTWTISQDSTTPNGFGNSTKWDCTTADTSIAADEYFGMDYRIEGHDVQHLKWGTSDAEYLTVGFWMKCDAAIAYSVGFINSDNSRHIRSLFTTSTSWTYHCIPFVGDTNSGPNDDSGEGLRLRFIFHGGSDITGGTLGTSWETTTAANQHVGGGSFFASTDRSIKMTGLQLERGYFTSETMPPFQFEDVGTSLRRCQRYCILMKADVTFTRFTHGFSWILVTANFNNFKMKKFNYLWKAVEDY